MCETIGAMLAAIPERTWNNCKEIVRDGGNGNTLKFGTKAVVLLAGVGATMYGIVKMTPPEFRSAFNNLGVDSEPDWLRDIGAGAVTGLTEIVVLVAGVWLSSEVATITGEIVGWCYEEVNEKCCQAKGCLEGIYQAAKARLQGCCVKDKGAPGCAAKVSAAVRNCCQRLFHRAPANPPVVDKPAVQV